MTVVQHRSQQNGQQQGQEEQQVRSRLKFRLHEKTSTTRILSGTYQEVPLSQRSGGRIVPGYKPAGPKFDETTEGKPNHSQMTIRIDAERPRTDPRLPGQLCGAMRVIEGDT